MYKDISSTWFWGAAGWLTFNGWVSTASRLKTNRPSIALTLRRRRSILLARARSAQGQGRDMDRLQQLSDIEDLRLLKAAYFYTLDHKLWAEWIALFTDDAFLKVDLAVTDADGEPPPARTIAGAATILEFISKEALAATARTVHHGHTFEYAFLSDREATGRWAMEDIVDHPTQGVLRGYGHYRETYRKTDGRWRFSSVHLTRLRLDWTPPARPA